MHQSMSGLGHGSQPGPPGRRPASPSSEALKTAWATFKETWFISIFLSVIAWSMNFAMQQLVDISALIASTSLPRALGQEASAGLSLALDYGVILVIGR